MPTGETSFDKESWRPHEYGLGAAHTNPSAEMTCSVNYIPRLLLDRAKSVEEAKALIESINWTEPVDAGYKDYETYPDSFEGMQELMKQAWFTRFYTIPSDTEEYWLSENASVYNITEGRLHVLVHEGLDGMDEFYEASLQSEFAKPLK